MAIKIFIRDAPQRAIALGTESHVLIFRHSPSPTGQKSSSYTSLSDTAAPSRCIVEWAPWEGIDMKDYRSLPSLDIKGTLGLVTLQSDVFLCVVNKAKKAATVRAGETVQQIESVEFHCLTRSDYDHLLTNQINPFPTDGLDADGFDQYSQHLQHARDPLTEHPCLKLKELLSGGSFYYSADFDLTKRLQDRPAEASSVAIDSLDGGFLWNAYMIQPLVEFRSRLSDKEKTALDQSGILTSAIRGYAGTQPVPASYSPARARPDGFPSNMTVISRLSCRRAGTRFNSRGIDDDGAVANFVETETIFSTDRLCFSYAQCRGSVPLFWEQQSGLPGQQKITITRSAEATKPAFDKHFDSLAKTYGDIFVVNLLSEEKPSETQLTRLYEDQIRRSPLNQTSKGHKGDESERRHLDSCNYDFHAETKGGQYESAIGIRRYIMQAAIAFDYYLIEDQEETIKQHGRRKSVWRQNGVLTQAGVFRTNCLDCLDRTNLVQTIISQYIMEMFLMRIRERQPTSDFWARHSILWADCGDALSKIYAGTGALKSSYTRSGKSSLAGMVADLRKSAQRLYINNFEDKGRQETIDMLLGRRIGQTAVQLFDPINDWVTTELNRRAAEFTFAEQISMWVGTFNLNGKTTGVAEDLSPWLCPKTEKQHPLPEIYAVAFQEIVNLDVQQIMSTDPERRQIWEDAVRTTLNKNATLQGSEEYVMLRGGQLVGASLSVFVKVSVLPFIKNVEGAVKKTGMSGMAGNKGAVAIRFEYADTSICLVTAHLAAGFANYQERNADYQTIISGIRFQRDRAIENHKTIVWFGDFNYRIGMTNERARDLINRHDLGQLYENDQLNIQMVHGKTFPYYHEQTPNFLPTYKFNLGTDEYDTSEKARIPAWCDRILTKGDNLKQLYYDSAPLRFSDHRPVWGLFQCTVSVVDQARKEAISAELYTRRRGMVGDHTANYRGFDSDESLYGYESIEPGLPPASSDKRKWWLDNGMPARSTLKPPSANHVPNPNRPSNPFSASPESDWIKVDRPAEKPSPPPSRQTAPARQLSEASVSRSQTMPRKLVPPPSLQSSTAAAGPPAPPRTTTLPPITNNTSDNTSSPHHQLKQTLRKPAPPPKPTVLRSVSGASTASARSTAAPPPVPDTRRAGGRVSSLASNGPNGDGTKPQPPPSRRVAAAPNVVEEAPSLPPRRPTGGLMDEDDGGVGGEGLRDWVPLKPS